MDITPPSTRKARAQAARIAMLEQRKLKKTDQRATEYSTELTWVRKDRDSLYRQRNELFLSVSELKAWKYLVEPPSLRGDASWHVGLHVADELFHTLRSDPHSLFGMIGSRLVAEMLRKWKEVTGR